MTQGFGSPLSVGATHMGFPAPGFGLSQSLLLLAFGVSEPGIGDASITTVCVCLNE